MLNKDIATKWVAALRSGDYTQTQKKLREEHGGMCCLGVLCDLYSKEHPEAYWKMDDARQSSSEGKAIPFVTDRNVREDIRNFDTAMPSHTVRRWVAEDTSQDDHFMSSLAVENDQGATFAEIADRIETYINSKVEANVE